MAFILRRPGTRSYTTTFPLTENPISEGGRWINGLAMGIDWGNVRTTPGFAFGANVSVSPPYDDPTAVLTGAWGPVQTVEAIIGAVPASSAQNQEVELRVLTSITPHLITGYEFLFSVRGDLPYLEILRWEGCANDISCFASLAFSGGNPPLAVGYRIKASRDVTGLLSLFVDYSSGRALGDPAGYGAAKLSFTDNTYTSGAPGVGFFQHGGSAATLSDFGLSSFMASAF